MLIKDDILVVKIGGLTFNAFKGIKPYWTLNPEAMVGWTDGVDMKRAVTPRPVSVGDFAEQGYASSRLISVSGIAVSETPEQLHKMRDDFTKILNHGGYEQMSVQNKVGTRYATVGLATDPKWIQQLDTVAVWKLELYAPDGRIYGPSQTVKVGDAKLSGGMSYPISYPLDYNIPDVQVLQYIVNDGNATGWPIFKVTGDFFSGFTVTDSARRKVTYKGMVTFSSPVTIDMSRGSAIQNGVDKTTLVTERGWISLKPGETLRPNFLPIQDGPGWCDIIFRDTWI